MRRIDRIDVMDRRDFFGRSIGGVLLISATPGVAQAVTLRTGEESEMRTLVRMARDLYPHDRLPDIMYETAVKSIEDQLAADPAKANALLEGVVELDLAAKAAKGKPYIAIEAEGDRVAILQSLEKAKSPIFTTMRSGMVTALYNQEEMWPKLGYEGSSAEKGGYIHRGFDDVDWLTA